MRARYDAMLYLALALLVWPPVAWVLANSLIVERPLDHADAILVLSGSAAYIERTSRAAEAFRAGLSNKVLLTNDGNHGGWSSEENRNPAFFELAEQQLIANGVPKESIEVIPGVVDGTGDEATEFIKWAGQNKLASVLLVTSSYHSRRALWTLNAAALRGNSPLQVGVIYSTRGDAGIFGLTWWFRREGWRSIGFEYVKLAYYWVFY